MDEPTRSPTVRTSLPAGTRIGRYTIVDRIGAGGMAELFLARQDGPRGFAKPIALKLLHQHVAEDPEFIAMFEREARVAAALIHPNVVQVLDVGFAGGEHFLALEYVHGRDLRRIIVAQRGPLPLGCAVRVVLDVARALAYVHRRSGLVHRDISPANVLVGFSGSVKLADFGIAKAADQTAHTSTGLLKGKFGYMAPEQYLQQSVDARSDLYALGVVLYEATTGRRAFAGAQTFSIMNRALAGDYVPPGSIVPEYPTALERLIARLLAVDPAQRPQDATEVIEALEAFAREADLDIGESTLATHVSGLFGHPGEPTLVTPHTTAGAPTTTIADDDAVPTASTRRRGRMPRAAMLGMIGGIGIAVGAIGGWRMARGEPSAAIEVAAEPPVASDAPPPIVQPAPVVAPLASPPSLPAEPTAAPAAAPPGTVKTSPRRRARPHKRAGVRDDADLAEMFPKAMR